MGAGRTAGLRRDGAARWGVVALLLQLSCSGGPAPAPAAPPSEAAPPQGRVGRAACDGLPVIRFAEPLCARLASGGKRITLRARHRTTIAAGARVQLVCMESRRRWSARIVSVRHTTWAGISAEELRDDGFAGRDQLLPVMRRYYPGIVAADPATVYRWGRGSACATAHSPGPLR